MIRSIVRWLVGADRRGLPRVVARPASVLVAGESWPSYIPPEPMTHALAQDAHAARERATRDTAWRATIEGMRNRRAP
jgi:hypothetical protein